MKYKIEPLVFSLVICLLFSCTRKPTEPANLVFAGTAISEFDFFVARNTFCKILE